MTDLELKEYLFQRRSLIDQALEAYLPPADEYPGPLHEAMRYSVFAGGKRLRSILTLAAAEAVGGQAEGALAVAAAIELIHTYSLIHDDLPAMDDDDLRRGKPTCHRVYGEAIAILAGDSLLTHAFALLSDEKLSLNPAKQMALIKEIAGAAGTRGMLGGQAVDILSEDQEIEPATLEYLHTHKTGSLIRAALLAGGIVAGASEGKLAALSMYGEKIGLAFQIVDDVLDIEGKAEELGKSPGSDKKKKKATYPALIGLSESKQRARELIAEAKEALVQFGERGEVLRALADYILRRQA
ncbi:MAG: polyprenyl synthetase family protein [candidate division NC10 bacterium]|nr:polyprenyl synthetase family protein [candidate division NC10 bacterium]